MIDVDLRDHHRHVWRPAVCAVIRHYRSLCFCIGFLDGTDLILCHIYGTEYKVYRRCHLFYFIDIMYDQFLNGFRHRRRHFPAPAHRFFISFACGTGTCRHRHHFEPGMIFQQGNKTLSYHSRRSQDSYFQFLFHKISPPLVLFHVFMIQL